MPRGRRHWASMVLFVFCVLESKFKDILSKRQNDHYEWIFRLVWFPQSWRYMFKLMASISNKTHHVNINASNKDSVPLSFFHLDKNYWLRECDPSNKVLPNSKKSNDKICIELMSNCVTSVQDVNCVEICCLHCNKVYK